jgi:hypothetical protein
VRKLRLTLQGCPVFFYREQALARLVADAGWGTAGRQDLGCLRCLDLRARR